MRTAALMVHSGILRTRASPGNLPVSSIRSVRVSNGGDLAIAISPKGIFSRTVGYRIGAYTIVPQRSPLVAAGAAAGSAFAGQCCASRLPTTQVSMMMQLPTSATAAFRHVLHQMSVPPRATRAEDRHV